MEKRYDLEGFAGYSWQIRTTERFITTADPLVKYVQQMSDVMLCLELCGDEEYCKQVVNLWNSFSVTFQQAKEFVSSQTPLKAQGLEENIRVSVCLCMCSVLYVCVVYYMYVQCMCA